MVGGTLSLVQKGQTSGRSGCSTQWNSGIWWWEHCLWCKNVKPVDAVHSGIVVYGGGDIVFGAKGSNQWTKYYVDEVHSMQWNSGIWWWGHCLWCKKVKPVDTVDAVHSGYRSNQWMQYAVDAVHRGIVVYGGGDIVFAAKWSNQWMQWMWYTVDAVGSGIVVYDCGDIVLDTKKVKPVDTVCSTQWMQWNNGVWWWRHCLWCKKVKLVDAVDAVCSGHSGCSGIVVYGGVSAVYCIQCIHRFDLFAPKTLSPPPYTTNPSHTVTIISLHPLSNASTGLTFFLPKTMSRILLHPPVLCTAFTASTGLTFLHQRQCPHHHIPLFHCIHCVLHQLHPLV